MIGLQLRLIRLDYTCKRVGSRSSTLAIFRLLPFYPMVTFNHHTGKLISGWPRHAVSRHQKTSGEPRDDFGFFPCRWKHRKTTTVSDYHGPFTQPSPLISFSSFLPISIYLSISLSTVCFLSLLCPSEGSRQLDPLCSVQVVPFSFAPCPPSCSYTDSGASPTCRATVRLLLLSFIPSSLAIFPSVSQYHLITSIQFSFAFLFFFSLLPLV